MARRSNGRQCVTSSLVCSASLFQCILAVDSVSIYDTPPTLSYFWNPSQAVPAHLRTDNPSKNSVASYELGPHPSDPHSILLPPSSSTTFPSPPEFNLPSVASTSSLRHGTPSGRRRNSSRDENTGRFGPGSGVNCIERVSGQQLWVYGEERGFVILTFSADLI